MQRLATGDQQAVAALYDRYAALVMAVALRILRDHAAAEDLLTEVFVELWRRADRYDASRGAPVTYIATLARSRAIDRLRARGRTEMALDAIPEPGLAPQAPDLGLVAEEQSTRVRQALAGLQDDQRKAIELAYYEGLSHAEISDRLQRPLGTVKTWIRQGLIHLRDAIRMTGDGSIP